MSERTDDALLQSILATYQLRARITDNMHYCGRWRDWDPQAPPGTAWFHLLDEGSCLIRCQGIDQNIRLDGGDMVVLSRGTAHVLLPLDQSPKAEDDFTTMLCGELSFVSISGNPVMDALPEVMVVRGNEADDAFRHIATLLQKEAQTPGLGSQAVMDKLADALFVIALRQYLERSDADRGLFAALADPRLRKALDAIHRDPGNDWTVASLADVACLSRTAFAERFAEVLEETPYQYLTRWRMAEALKLLQDPRMSVAHVATRLGYATEAAFRRSFKRIHGYGPGAVRRAARAA